MNLAQISCHKGGRGRLLGVQFARVGIRLRGNKACLELTQGTHYVEAMKRTASSALDTLVAQLQDYRFDTVPPSPDLARAAVAVVLLFDGQQTRILFIRRAESANDPWSGHMAFPGGRAHSDELDNTRLTAERETREELSLDLVSRGRYIGRMSDILATAKGRHVPLVITPWVYVMDEEPELDPNYEVAEALWVPLSFFSEKNREEFDFEFNEYKIRLPMFLYEGRKIWGLTLRMMDELLEVVEGAREARFPSIPKDIRME